MTYVNNYLLAGGSAELERLRLQAQVWEPETEEMLDLIGVQSGWSCVDLGCGGMGILGPLSRRVGPRGCVIGVDTDAKQLAAVYDYVKENKLKNVTVLEQDAYRTTFPRESFDFTHVRFVFAPVGRDEELLREMLSLTRPGGVVAIQEPDASSWNCYPPHPAWGRLKETILSAFVRWGGNFNVGQRTYGMLRSAGLKNVQVRAAIVALQDNHPYMKSPLQFATSLRKRIVDGGILSESELDGLTAECEQIVNDPDTIVTSFTVTQVWGHKPNY